MMVNKPMKNRNKLTSNETLGLLVAICVSSLFFIPGILMYLDRNDKDAKQNKTTTLNEYVAIISSTLVLVAFLVTLGKYLYDKIIQPRLTKRKQMGKIFDQLENTPSIDSNTKVSKKTFSKMKLNDGIFDDSTDIEAILEKEASQNQITQQSKPLRDTNKTIKPRRTSLFQKKSTTTFVNNALTATPVTQQSKPKKIDFGINQTIYDLQDEDENKDEMKYHVFINSKLAKKHPDAIPGLVTLCKEKGVLEERSSKGQDCFIVDDENHQIKAKSIKFDWRAHGNQVMRIGKHVLFELHGWKPKHDKSKKTPITYYRSDMRSSAVTK